ncbi:protein FAR1-RELATED SEQUENCE 5-like [Senna tora]|uniref:Protein FAR1-RELATED SEQUENCE 5-like n=1 Tax=Senna tora TaxID=362788 RepID=A0A834SZU3_9FABA|nr:protein FAR1-RELATED SEQUENCE 5-like [Senna tora]
MILDYSHFGDVVSFDTTYCINNAHRPLAIFSGFNHFKGGVIFGAALLYDETAASFKWLFETFLKANLQKKPQTIFTDQDQAMAKALREVMSENLQPIPFCVLELLISYVEREHKWTGEKHAQQGENLTFSSIHAQQLEDEEAKKMENHREGEGAAAKWNSA